MEPAALVAGGLPKLGIVVAAFAAAMTLAVRDERRRAIAMAVALVLATALLIDHIRDTEQFDAVAGSPTRLVLAGLLALAGVAGLGALFDRRPELLALAVVAVLPFRVPIEAAGATVNLLVPLYVVIAGGCGAYVWRRLVRGDVPEQGRPRSSLELALAVFLVLYAVQAVYSRDFDTALEQTVFFLIPFAILFRLLTRVPWTRQLVVRCLAILVAEALIFCAIGFWEYQQRELFWNPKVIASNQFDSFFRVNSVFWDPNIYGRFLVLVTLALVALMLWSDRAKTALWTAACLAVLWGGVVLTFSQSSFVALLAGLAVLAALRWDVRKTVIASAAGVLLALAAVLALQGPLNIELSSSSGREAFTSGRSNLIGGGMSLFGDRPLWGYGPGGFGRAYRQEQNGNQQESVSASHTLPITIAAEQGLIGLAAYIAVLMTALATLFGNRRFEESAGHAESERGPPVSIAARAALAAMFVALVVHTMAYAAFLEDPFSWVLMAAGLSLAPAAALAGWQR